MPPWPSNDRRVLLLLILLTACSPGLPMSLVLKPAVAVTPNPSSPPLHGRVHMLNNGFMCASNDADLLSERNSATVYLAASAADIEIESGGVCLRAGAMLVLPRVRKHFRARGEPFVCLDIHPTHRAYRHFATLPGAGVQVLPREHFAELASALRDFHSGALPPAESGELYDRVVERTAALLPEMPPLDPRVRQVMRMLRHDPGLGLQQLADAVCMSTDWLSHLFRREVGISLRKYEQMLKLQTAAGHVGSSQNLTQIAALAGFADSAHLSRVWKQHFGMPPNAFFINQAVNIDPLPAWPCVELRRRSVQAVSPIEGRSESDALRV